MERKRRGTRETWRRIKARRGIMPNVVRREERSEERRKR